VRIICATHRDLQTLIQSARFREDLFYRISEVAIELPPLRDRAGDAVLLAQHFLEQAARRHGRAVHGFTAKALKAIEANSWRGNVRELENAINSAVIMADGKQIGPEALRFGTGAAEEALDLREVRAEAEKRAIRRALTREGGNLSRVALLLGVSRPTLYDLLEKYDLKKATDAG
jgi:two-component system NtrC family response regulator